MERSNLFHHPWVLLALAALIVPGCGEEEPIAEPAAPPEADLHPLRLAPGDRLEDHLAPGKSTCVVFQLKGKAAPGLDLDGLARRKELAVRTIELDDWSSPLRERFDVASVPWLVLFDAEGRLVAAGYDRTVLDRLESIP